MSQRLKLGALFIFLAFCFFAPIPSIIAQEIACQPCTSLTNGPPCPRCPKKGDIIWGKSLYQLLLAKKSTPPPEGIYTIEISPVPDSIKEDTKKGVDCGEPDSEGRCANGCVNYGVPLGCVTQKEFESCKKSKYGCPVCLSSSTEIAVEKSTVNVVKIKLGMNVWTMNKSGVKELRPVIKISVREAGKDHHVSRLILTDGRILYVSPSHPTTHGKPVGDLQIGELYDGSVVQSNELVPYRDSKTYDLLPAGDTGYYFANSILMGSTLK